MEGEENTQASSKREDLLIEAKKFFGANKEGLGQALRKGNGVLFIDFMQITEFSNILSEEICKERE